MSKTLDWMRREAQNEFNQNYLNYLENYLLFSILNENLLLLVGAKSTSIEKELKENLVKSHLFQYKLSENEMIMDEIHPEELSSEAKTALVDKIYLKLESKLSEINQYFNFFDKESSSSVPTVAKSNAFDDSDFSNETALNPTLKNVSIDRLKLFANQLSNLSAQIEKYKTDLSVKSEHCFNISVNILNLIKTLLKDFKLDFFLNQKNRSECDAVMLKYDMLVAKATSIYNELLADMYTPEKVRALSLIRSQVNLETSKTQDQLEDVQLRLNVFSSFGKEFDQVLKDYLMLKEELDNKLWMLNHLKSNVRF